MPDRENVIKGCECCSATNHGRCESNDCPYWAEDDMNCIDALLIDAIALLKEQGAEAEWLYGEDETGADGWHCSECGFFEPWFYEYTDDIDFIRFYGFCPRCGRRMTPYTGKPTQEGR